MELTDAGAACSDSCGTIGAPFGETWSRPVVGRIKVVDTASPTADASGFDDRYVAIFGGGYDPSFTPGDDVATKLGTGAVIQGRAFYMVDIETGAILYKMQRGVNESGKHLRLRSDGRPLRRLRTTTTTATSTWPTSATSTAKCGGST